MKRMVFLLGLLAALILTAPASGAAVSAPSMKFSKTTFHSVQMHISGSADYYRYYYAEEGSPELRCIQTIRDTEGVSGFTTNIQYLKDNTAYVFYAESVKGNESAVSAEYRVKTKKLSVPAPTVKKTTFNSITLDIGYDAAYKGEKVEIYLARDFASKDFCLGYAGVSEDKPVQLEYLMPNTIYHIYVRKGENSYSPTITAKTPKYQPPACTLLQNSAKGVKLGFPEIGGYVGDLEFFAKAAHMPEPIYLGKKAYRSGGDITIANALEPGNAYNIFYTLNMNGMFLKSETMELKTYKPAGPKLSIASEKPFTLRWTLPDGLTYAIENGRLYPATQVQVRETRSKALVSTAYRDLLQYTQAGMPVKFSFKGNTATLVFPDGFGVYNDKHEALVYLDYQTVSVASGRVAVPASLIRRGASPEGAPESRASLFDAKKAAADQIRVTATVPYSLVFYSANPDGNYMYAGMTGKVGSELRIGGLLPKTTYYVRIAYYSRESGYGGYWPDSLVATKAVPVKLTGDIPGPTQLKAANTRHDRVTLSWKPTGESPGIPVILYALNETGPYRAATSLSLEGKTAITLTRLKAGTTYYFKVYEKMSRLSTTRASDITKVTTKSSRPGNITATAKPSSIALQWDSVYTAEQKPVTHISRAASKNGSYHRVGETTGRKYTVQGLAQGREYFFRLQDFGIGNATLIGPLSAMSAPVSFACASTKPEITKVTAGKGSAALSVKRAKNAADTLIFISEKQNGPFRFLVSAKTAASVTAKNIPKGTYYLRAADGMAVDTREYRNFSAFSEACKVTIK